LMAALESTQFVQLALDTAKPPVANQKRCEMLIGTSLNIQAARGHVTWNN